MFRALSTRSHKRYEKLGEEPTTRLLDDQVKLQRSATLPAGVLRTPPSGKFSPETVVLPSSQVKPSPVKKGSAKSHPLFSLFDRRRKSKKTTTARPEFARYLEYVKEGGLWDVNSNKPVIFYR